MPNTINIPTPLRPFTDKKEAVEVSGATVGELLTDLTTRYEGLRKHLYADNGKLRNFVNVYLNDEDIRYLQREATPVKAGDTLSIVPSVAGGAPTTAAPPETDLSPEEIKRYSRHLIMPEMGMDGQRKLKAVECPLHRGRRTWISRGDVSGSCRHRPHRYRRLRRGGLQ